MVYFRNDHAGWHPVPFNTGLLESTGYCMVSSSHSVLSDAVSLRLPHMLPLFKPTVSIVICTLDRQESLNDTLESLTKQTFKNFEVLLITEKGNLSELRDRGLHSSCGDIVCFIDDDVYCPPTWLQSTVECFGEGVVGVTGPTWITKEYRQNRDIIKYQTLRKAHDAFFRVPSKPGHLSQTGAPSMASNDQDCEYQGPVQYLECCNMSVKRKEALNAGGFDHIYYRTSEWCELDLSFRLSKKGKLVFSQNAGLYHRPSKAGVYKARLQTDHRWKNFITFQKRWVQTSFLTYIYRGFIWTYLKMKNLKMI